MVTEVLQQLQRLRPVNRPQQRFGAFAEIVDAAIVETLQDLLDVVVETQWLGNFSQVGRAQSLAIVGIEIPLAAERLIAIHQQIESFAHLAVKRFHAVVFAGSNKSGKLRLRQQEMLALKFRYGDGVIQLHLA